MSPDRDVTRIVRSWLNEDRHEDADRVLNTVLAELDTTPQRRSWWSAWRFPIMNNVLRVGLVAAAVVIIAVIAINLLPGSPAPGGEPSVTPTPQPTATPEATPAAFVYPPAGPLAIGRHPLTVQGVPLSFSLPTSGWSVDVNGFIIKDTAVAGTQPAFLFRSPVNIYSDPCTQTPLSPPAGPSAADLAAAISTAHGTDATEPSDVTVGGRAAKYVVLTLPEDSGCFGEDPNHFYLWYNDCAGTPSVNAENCYRYGTAAGDTIRLWIIDVDGARLVIEAETRKSASSEVQQELQQIVDSIQFE